MHISTKNEKELNGVIARWLEENGQLKPGESVDLMLSVSIDRAADRPGKARVRTKALSEEDRERDVFLARPTIDLRVDGHRLRFEHMIVNSCIGTIGELVRRDQRQLIKYRNVGQVLISAIEKALAEHGLALGMKDLPVGPRERAIRRAWPIDHYELGIPDEVAGAIRSVGCLAINDLFALGKRKLIPPLERFMGRRYDSFLARPMWQWTKDHPTPEAQYYGLLDRANRVLWGINFQR